jgi:1-pyrroline-5-carboxylate dehydrogenase
MSNALFTVPLPTNEPILTYAPNSSEKIEIKNKLKELKGKQLDIPLIIGGKEIRTDNTATCIIPHNKKHILATYHKATAEDARLAVEAALEARHEWNALPWESRATLFLTVAELLSGPWRSTLNAATMLCQSKTIHQAEIDSACELIDFFRFNVFYMAQIYAQQPHSAKGMWNRVDYRPLEGFVLAVTPFNFTSIAGNLPCSPALMGNTVVWKPASTAVYSGYFLMKLLQAAGLPDGVINFLPGAGEEIGSQLLTDPALAGVHFTGSTATFQGMWKTIGTNIEHYHSYPRIVGETGGKDFIFVHSSFDDIEALCCGIVRGAFEYQGQKCSAASRAYIPASLWPALKARLLEIVPAITYGDTDDFRHFGGSLIDQNAFDKVRDYLDYAQKSADMDVLIGGDCDDAKGFFVSPTVVQTENPKSRLMEEEIFGPVITVYVYEDEKYEETLQLCNETSPYALTGCIWARNRAAIVKACEIMRHAAGNFYINDKPTAAVVGEQPFGGSRASGTNDKAGSRLNLLRWTSVQTIKETFIPPRDPAYPFMAEE